MPERAIRAGVEHLRQALRERMLVAERGESEPLAALGRDSDRVGPDTATDSGEGANRAGDGQTDGGGE